MSEQKEKFFFVLNSDLKMGVGKTASQIAHAMLKVTFLCIAKRDQAAEDQTEQVFNTAPFHLWLANGEPR